MEACSLSTSTFPRLHLIIIVAEDMQISQTNNDSSCSLRVLLYETREAKERIVLRAYQSGL